MQKQLKMQRAIAKKEAHKTGLLLLIVATELLALGWLSWLIFHINHI